jgi:phosphoadenosine phosphosulfate reductase
MGRVGQEWVSEALAAVAEGDVLGLLRQALAQFGERMALASSLGAEDQVLLHMLSTLTPSPRVFTLDTGRLPQETYDLMAATTAKYGIRIEVAFPDRREVERLVNEGGPNLFYDGIPQRRACCRVRKVLPLERKLGELDAWITGLRREQSPTRTAVPRVEWDAEHGLVKLNPLAEWTRAQVWDYLRTHDVPYSRLHDQGYPSLGCAPCTRAVADGEDERAGRWWWEHPEHKECGLHIRDGKVVRGG